ncbi:hypothetical protein JL720_11832 [Aureococcus anophagefferens]|nr:hypothetical protein JL720_11832 [Aureococcus anophagefferens]
MGGPFDEPHLDDVERTWGAVFAAGAAAPSSKQTACLRAWSSASASVAESLTFGEFWARAVAVGARLGGGHDDRVVFLSHPSVRYYVAAAGAFARQCAVVNLNWRQPASALRHAVATVDAAAFVVSDPLADLADEVGSFRGAPRHRLDDLFDESPPPPNRSPVSGLQAGPRDVAVVMFTSGSTGRPKGVPMTHAGLLHACRSKLVAHGGFPNVARGTVSFLPNFHVIGFVNNFLFNGYARCPGAVLVEAASALITVDLLEKAIGAMAPDSVDTVPTILEAVANSAASRPDVVATFAKVRLVTCGGAPLPSAAYDALSAAGIHPMPHYGQTEFSGGFCLVGAPRAGRDVMRPVQGCVALILGDDEPPLAGLDDPRLAGAAAEAADAASHRIRGASRGELVVLHCASATPGYLGLDAPDPPFTVVRHTGDVFERREIAEARTSVDGTASRVYLKHVCRRDDVIIHRTGELTNPLPYEDLLAKALGAAAKRVVMIGQNRNTPVVLPGDLPVSGKGNVIRGQAEAKYKDAMDAMDADMAAFFEQAMNERNSSAVSKPKPKHAVDEAAARSLVESTCERLIGKRVPGDAPLLASGLNSTGLVQLVKALASELGADLSPTLIFDYPSIDAIVDYLSGKEDDDVARGLGAANGASESAQAVRATSTRLPSSLRSPAALWDASQAGSIAVGHVPLARWDRHAVELHKALPAKASKTTQYGAFLSLGPDVFDAELFRMKPVDVANCDPQQRLLLEPAAALKAALRDGSATAESVAFLEQHGTGTPLGDPIEVSGAAAVLASPTSSLDVGGVKANCGHAEAAAGVSGLVKANQVLQRKASPTNAALRRLNPEVRAVRGLEVFIPADGDPIPPRLFAAGASSFGWSGIIAHALQRNRDVDAPAPLERGAAKPSPFKNAKPVPPLYGTRPPLALCQGVSFADGAVRVLFKVDGRLLDSLRDHVIGGVVLLPGVASVELALSSTFFYGPNAGALDRAALKSVAFLRPCAIDINGGTRVRVTFDGGDYDVEDVTKAPVVVASAAADEPSRARDLAPDPATSRLRSGPVASDFLVAAPPPAVPRPAAQRAGVYVPASIAKVSFHKALGDALVAKPAQRRAHWARDRLLFRDAAAEQYDCRLMTKDETTLSVDRIRTRVIASLGGARSKEPTLFAIAPRTPALADRAVERVLVTTNAFRSQASTNPGTNCVVRAGWEWYPPLDERPDRHDFWLHVGPKPHLFGTGPGAAAVDRFVAFSDDAAAGPIADGLEGIAVTIAKGPRLTGLLLKLAENLSRGGDVVCVVESEAVPRPLAAADVFVAISNDGFRSALSAFATLAVNTVEIGDGAAPHWADALGFVSAQGTVSLRHAPPRDDEPSRRSLGAARRASPTRPWATGPRRRKMLRSAEHGALALVVFPGLATARAPAPKALAAGAAAAAPRRRRAAGASSGDVETLATVLALASGLAGKPVGDDEALMAAGIDSLAATELAQSLAKTFGVDVPGTILFDYPTAKDIAGYLAAERGAAGEADAEPTTEVAVVEAAPRRRRRARRRSGGSASKPTGDASALATVLALASSLAGKPVGDDEALMAAGIDSLAATELAQSLAKTFRVDVPGTILFDYPTAKDIAAYLAAEAGVAAADDDSDGEAIFEPGAELVVAAAADAASLRAAILVAGPRLPACWSLADLYEMTKAGGDCGMTVPLSRWDATALPLTGPVSARAQYGVFMENVGDLDMALFQIQPIEANSLDPQQKLLLDVGYGMLKLRGHDRESLNGSLTGVFLGMMNRDADEMLGPKGFDALSPFDLTGNGYSAAGARLSYVYAIAPSVRDVGHGLLRVLIEAAVADATREPWDVDFLEMHGTGTALGDPVEVGAPSKVLASAKRAAAKPLALCGVKGTFGHTEASAGAAGIVKALGLFQGWDLGRNAQLRTLNPQVKDVLAVKSVGACDALPATPKLGGVSSFGFSGIIAHAQLFVDDLTLVTPSTPKLDVAVTRHPAKIRYNTAPDHRFLTARNALPRPDGGAVFTFALGPALLRDLGDHVVSGEALFPGVGYVEFAFAGILYTERTRAKKTRGAAVARVDGFTFLKPTVMPKDGETKIMTLSLYADGAGDVACDGASVGTLTSAKVEAAARAKTSSTPPASDAFHPTAITKGVSTPFLFKPRAAPPPPDEEFTLIPASITTTTLDIADSKYLGGRGFDAGGRRSGCVGRFAQTFATAREERCDCSLSGWAASKPFYAIGQLIVKAIGPPKKRAAPAIYDVAWATSLRGPKPLPERVALVDFRRRAGADGAAVPALKAGDAAWPSVVLGITDATFDHRAVLLRAPSVESLVRFRANPEAALDVDRLVQKPVLDRAAAKFDVLERTLAPRVAAEAPEMAADGALLAPSSPL